jgi:hypothetical protein
MNKNLPENSTNYIVYYGKLVSNYCEEGLHTNEYKFIPHN